ncbi:glutamate ABC transporter substrate-binding protein [Actinacidiphila sp. bgisy144]|uniref:glutamate ABC transporter substrate-binding protein n=1 Tax=Actinacidiphila sp. bgisy144 TaxID=3413791 RepID=UPI003EBFFC5B
MSRTARGWGGVAAMAAACALTVTAALGPLGVGPLGGGSAAGDTPGVATGRTVHVQDAAATDAGSCTTPEASLSPSSGSTDGAAVERIRKRGRLIVGVDQNSYLWGFRDPETGAITGFDIDIVKAIAQNILGSSAKVQYLTVPTDKRVPDIQDHKVDMVVRTMSITCDRLKQVAFSIAYFEAGQQLLVPKDSAITGFDDSLAGKRVCTASGSTGYAKLQQGAHGARVTTVDNQLDCLVLLQLGQVDAVFTDNALAAGQAAQDPTVHLVGQPVTKEPYGVAMNLDDQDLVRRVNQVLAAYEAGGADSAWMHAYETWLAKDLPGVTGPPAPTYK